MKTLVILLGCCGMLASARAQDIPANLQPYTVCHFDDGLEIGTIQRLYGGGLSDTVDTSQGKRTVSYQAGQEITFLYPGASAFADVLARELSAASYATAKRDLIANFEYLAASAGNVRNTTMKPHLNGFEIYGVDKETQDGSAIARYLFFDDTKHIATTVNLFSQGQTRTFEEYGRMRDKFLQRYTTCVSVSLE